MGCARTVAATQYNDALPDAESIPFPIRSLEHLAVVLVAPRNNLNIGAVARAMSNFGVHDLRLAQIFYKEFRTAASAVGPSALLLAASREYDATAEAIKDATLVVGTTGDPGRDFRQPVERLEAGALRIRSALDRGQRVALLFGSEKFGLSREDMSHCHLLLRIPTRDEHASMNLGQAAALCLYELARQPDAGQSVHAPTETRDATATAGELERLAALLTDVLTQCEYPGIAPGARTRHLRSMLRRWRLSEPDTAIIAGFLRQMRWKLGGSRE